MTRCLCFFALLVFAGRAADGKVADNYFRQLPWRAVEIPTPEYDAFRQRYREILGTNPESIETLPEMRVVRIGKSDIETLKQNGLEFRGARPLPFRYYDETYAPRLRRGFESLGDLISGYKDDKLNKKLLRAVSQQYPKLVSYHVLGKTRLGREIVAVKIVRGGSKKHRVPILLTGSHHASEMTSTEHCYRILYDLLSEPAKYRRVFENHVIWMVPLVNPDGAHFFWHISTAMGRKNGYLASDQNENSFNRGVDLNRNYPFQWNSGNPKASSDDPENFYYRGPQAASEPETQALMRLARAQRFVYAISFHSKASKILFPYTIDNLANPTPDIAREFAEELAAKVDNTGLPREFTAAKNLYSVDGTDQDYHYHTHGTLAYILETSYENCEYRYVMPYLEKYRALTDAFLFDYSRRKKFALRIRDAQQKPIAAKITFSDQEFFHGEKRISDAGNGSFIRVTNSDEKVVATISAKGFKTRHISLKPQTAPYPALKTITLQRRRRRH